MPEHETASRRAARAGERGRRDGARRPRLSRGYARARERDAAARAELRPLAPGERPPALAVAAGVAALIAIGNLALMAGAGRSTARIRPLAARSSSRCSCSPRPSACGSAATSPCVAFQALLGLGITWAGLSLLVAANAAAVALCLTLIAGGGWLFWKLVRVMGRIQAARRTEEPVG